MNFRRLLVNIHYFGGLACFWYLIVLGISSLHFNHHFSFINQPTDTVAWKRDVFFQNSDIKTSDLSEHIRDSLSLIGWPLPWETLYDSTGHYHFVVEHPGKRYVIDYSFSDHTAKVLEIRKSFWQVFISLHGAGEVPNTPVMDVWSWYTRLTTVVVLISVLTGIYIWLIGKKDKTLGSIVLIISFLAAYFWMAFMYLHG
ncbi:MAG: hypothetical protein C0490_22945 [Marivirga sp.]|nr:hypothetical protein [Marivirga sp.]